MTLAVALGLLLCYASATCGFHYGYALGFYNGEVKAWFQQADHIRKLNRDCHPRGDDSIKATRFDGKEEV